MAPVLSSCSFPNGIVFMEDIYTASSYSKKEQKIVFVDWCSGDIGIWNVIQSFIIQGIIMCIEFLESLLVHSIIDY